MSEQPRRPERRIVELDGLDPAEVISELNGRAEPAVLRGLCADWPLVRASADLDAVEQLLLEHDQGATVTAFLGEPGTGGRYFYDASISKLEFEQIRTRLPEVLDRIRSSFDVDPAPSVYMGSMAIDHCLPGLRPTHALPSGDLPTTVRIWIGNRSRVATHFDVLDNIACVCVGQRRFTLFPPDQLANLYVGPLDLTPAGQQISLVDPEAPDFERFPRYADALNAGQWCELEPGDAIYIPSMWWHQVDARSPMNVLINHWWRDVATWMGAPGDVLLHALLNLRDLPERQRRAWRTMLDHYVFDPPENGLDHIPESSRGVLGEMDEDQARQIRARLRNALNR